MVRGSIYGSGNGTISYPLLWQQLWDPLCYLSIVSVNLVAKKFILLSWRRLIIRKPVCLKLQY